MTQIDLIGSVNILVVVGSVNALITSAADAGRVIVTLVSSTDLFWNSGKGTVTAVGTDRFLPAATPMTFRLPKGHDNLGAIRDTADGTLTIYTH